MNKQDAEKIITEYLKPIFGFALKRCKNVQDAEDLSQDIILKTFRALLIKDDIGDVRKFIWTIAHNTLSNYYRDSAKGVIGISIDEFTEVIADPDAGNDSDDNAESIRRLQNEIAYLSKLQRKILIAYYFENRKQADIAKELDIPLGTVKWHLFEAKKELKRGMDTMRKTSELKFNPIKFSLCGFSGSTGTKGSVGNFFRSPIVQNISYCIKDTPKTINEIADALGVSPVYIESEVEYLEEYGFLLKQGDKYIINFLLDESDESIIKIKDDMYSKAAKLFANELYDSLSQSPLLNNSNIVCCNRMVDINKEMQLPIFENDHNFLLWSLIPYITALSGEKYMDDKIKFEEVYTIRADGGKNICYASIENGIVPQYFDSMKKFCGPCWNGFTDKFILWTIDTEWSEKRIDDNYQLTVDRDLAVFERFFNDEELSDLECAYMNEKGYMRRYESIHGRWTGLQIAWIRNNEARKILLEFGDKIKEKYQEEFETLKTPYVKAVLERTPKHLHKTQMYGIQHIFFSDGWFILYCLKELVNNGKLKLPTEEQRKSLTTLIAPNI